MARRNPRADASPRRRSSWVTGRSCPGAQSISGQLQRSREGGKRGESRPGCARRSVRHSARRLLHYLSPKADLPDECNAAADRPLKKGGGQSWGGRGRVGPQRAHKNRRETIKRKKEGRGRAGTTGTRQSTQKHARLPCQLPDTETQVACAGRSAALLSIGSRPRSPAATARSAAGSVSISPPTTFT